MRLQSLFLLKHRHFASPHRVFAREPVAQRNRQHSSAVFHRNIVLLGEELCGLASSVIFNGEGDASHPHIITQHKSVASCH